MDKMVKSNRKITVWAHRGFNKNAPENTLSAFRQVLAAGELPGNDTAGYKMGIELDVCFSSDGRIVVIHDDSVDRTTDGTGAVSGLTYNELSSLDAGSWFGREFAGEKIPLLEEVLVDIKENHVSGTVSGSSFFLNIELKPSGFRESPEESLEFRVDNLLEKTNFSSYVLISSFNWDMLERYRRLNKNTKIGILLDNGWPAEKGLRMAERISAYSVHPEISDFLNNPEIFSNSDFAVYPWTVDNSGTAEQVLDSGADGYFADLPFSE
jgi:glycerophosphoryl diester phosphodiesterase